MAELSISVAQDQFICPVCLDLLKDPVTVPCGHSYCKVCINGYWDQEDQRRVCKCPQCRETFTPRPALRRNNMLAEVVEKMKKTEFENAETADVECDCCNGRKRKAVMPCLHELKKVQRKCEQRLQEKQRKVEEVKQAVITIKRSAQTAVEDSERIFTELISSMKKKPSKVTELIRDQEKAELSRAEGHLEQLEQEVADLKRRDAELQQLSHTEDHIHFHQSFQALCASSVSEDASSISVNVHPSFDGVRKCLSDFKKRLEELYREEFNKFCSLAAATQIILTPEPTSREEFMKYFCHLTLDPNTAHYNLNLSENNRLVKWIEGDQRYSDHPERFSCLTQVLCKESVCGRCYWEVEWSGEDGVSIAVSYKEIRRKGKGDRCSFGFNKQSWSLFCSSSLAFYHNNVETEISASPSSRIGVYVDQSAGTLSFYNVSDTMMLLHRVHTTFTQPLYAGFAVYGGTVRLCDPE